MQTQLAYWRSQLGGRLPILDLPTDRPRPAVQTFRGAERLTSIPLPLAEALSALSRRENSTLFMTLLAAFQALLHRYSGQDDLIVGSPIANREQFQTEGLIGFFVNQLVLRADLSGNPTFRELLARVREVCLGAYAHQDLPFAMLVEKLHPERDLSRTPLFQVMFVFENASPPVVGASELSLRPLVVENKTTKFDLTLALTEGAQGLAGGWEYSVDLFDPTTIIRMDQHFQLLLRGVAANPDLPIADLPLLMGAQRQQLLVEWNDTTGGDRGQGSGVSNITDEVCLHQLIAAQAQRTPDAIAVIFDFRDKQIGRQGDKELTRDQGSGIRDQDIRVPAPDPRPLTPDPWYVTYAELDARANQLAQHLRALGVGPEVSVGVCLERAPELVVALLAVLKAGGAYVPLDPSYPQERLAFMLEDSRAAVLVTDSIYDLRFTIDDLEESRTSIVNRKSKIVNSVIVNRKSKIVNNVIVNRKSKIVNPDNLAYLIYTSGSTGRPKGVAITHQSAVAFISWAQTVFTADELAGVLAATSISFDLSIFELFVTLSSGGTIILAENALALASSSAAQAVTLINTVPSAMNELVRSGSLPRSVRTVNLAGEALPGALVQALYAQTHTQRVYNLYGPSEDTTYSTYTLMPRDSATLPAIGRPIANSQVYLLDAHMRPVPIGVTGELYIGGVGLARGYHGRPDLTAERFVPNPWGSGFRVQGSGGGARAPEPRPLNPEPSPRLYRTGDRARYRPDGLIEYLGRTDQQVKLRGFRIELGEIAAVIMAHASVADAVVLLRADVAGAQLVAYVVTTKDEGRMTKDESAPSSIVYRPSSVVRELQTFLKARLPTYMLPAAFVLLDALPLTPNGKLDRRALPVPEYGGDPGGYLAPRTAEEEEIAGIWAALLGRARVGIHDNFFDIGGHSLLATQLISRIRDTFQLELPLRTIFEVPTVAELAERIEGLRWAVRQLAAATATTHAEDEEQGVL